MGARLITTAHKLRGDCSGAFRLPPFRAAGGAAGGAEAGADNGGGGGQKKVAPGRDKKRASMVIIVNGARGGARRAARRATVAATVAERMRAARTAERKSGAAGNRCGADARRAAGNRQAQAKQWRLIRKAIVRIMATKTIGNASGIYPASMRRQRIAKNLPLALIGQRRACSSGKL